MKNFLDIAEEIELLILMRKVLIDSVKSLKKDLSHHKKYSTIEFCNGFNTALLQVQCRINIIEQKIKALLINLKNLTENYFNNDIPNNQDGRIIKKAILTKSNLYPACFDDCSRRTQAKPFADLAALRENKKRQFAERSVTKNERTNINT